MRKFILRLCLFCILGVCSLYGENPLKIQSVMLDHYGENDFTAIPEFFAGRELKGRDSIVRTDDVCRGGLYFVVKLNKSIRRLGRGSCVQLKYILSNSSEKKENSFILNECGSSKYLYIGLTGCDNPGKNIEVLAWSLEVRGTRSGCAFKKSYLWEIP